MKAIFILSFLLATTIVFGQQLKTTEKRVEIDLKDGRYNEQVYTMGKYGVVLKSFSKDDGLKTNIYLHHDVYNTDLELYETDPLAYDPYLPIMSTYETEDHIFHLAYRRKKRPITVYEFDVKNKTSKRLDIEYSGSEKFRGIEYFQVLGQKAAAIGFSKSGVHFLSFDLEAQTVTSTPIYIEDFKPGRIIATNMQYLEDAKKYYVSLRVYKTSKLTYAYLLDVDTDGFFNTPMKIDESAGRFIKSITVGAVGESDVVIAGTYGNASFGPNNGIYFGASSEGEITDITSYNFLEIPNYLDYLPERDQNRLENKIERKASKGKELETSEYLVMHNLIPVDNDFLLITEAYYPTYRTEYRTTTVKGKTTTTPVQVFDGYQYTHAMIAKFNKEGEMLWSQVFKMYLWYKPFVARTFIRIAAQEQNSIQLVYADGKNIYSKSFSFDGEILYDKTSNPINTDNENDKVKQSYSNISYWYDKYFLSYGVQSIKNKVDDDVKRKRTVLFLNKVSFE
ncbi:MAG: hypothetical protein EAZ48_03435 [Flavobacteriia bacterium]|jgi:hypothetical protein|nr:MAG: hypothetical protein EAZ48_03435 [Flavobacteriia bacterium]